MFRRWTKGCTGAFLWVISGVVVLFTPNSGWSFVIFALSAVGGLFFAENQVDMLREAIAKDQKYADAKRTTTTPADAG